VRSSDAGTRVQTRALAAHRRELVAQLRDEIGVPGVAAGRAALVMVMGYPGVGKSHVARLLASRLGAAHVATDHLRRRLFIAPTYGVEENGAVFGIAEALVDQLLSEGHVVVLDATHLLARYRAPAEKVARARGAPIHHVLVTSDDSDTRARLERRMHERADGDHSDADIAVYERMRAGTFEPPDGGHLEIRNGDAVGAEVARVASLIQVAL
jgi:predicted kinase